MIVGYFKEILPCLICELKEGSNDYLQDTVCRGRTAGMMSSCADDAGESGCEQHANALRSLCVACADHQWNPDQFDIPLQRRFIVILTKRSVHQRVFIRCVFGVYSSVSQLEVSFGSGFDAVISRSRRGFGSWSTRWRRTFSSTSPPSVLHRFPLMLTHSRHGEHAI